MKEYQRKFIANLLDKQVLKFGEFQLKSGRISPYFFNLGIFNNGNDLNFLGEIYAKVIIDSDINFDILFGLAYKGITIACTTAVSLFNLYQRNVSCCFNRKETKRYGEQGLLFGSSLYGNVLLIDDVITAGTTINKAIKIIKTYNAKLSGIIIALDRQEKGRYKISAIQEIEKDYNCRVISLITLKDIISFLKERKDTANYLAKIISYQQQYGIL